MSYARIFIPLVQEAKGYEFKGRPPAGRCIIEERGHTGKLSAWVQDLKPETRYSIYLIFVAQHRYAGIHMGVLDIDPRGKGEIRRDIDGLDLYGFALSNVTAVAVIAMGTSSSAIVSPLCGYKDRAVSWKHDFFEPAKIKKAEKQKKPESLPVQEVLQTPEATLTTEHETVIETPEVTLTTEHETVIETPEVAFTPEHTPVMETPEATLTQEHEAVIENPEATLTPEHEPVIETPEVTLTTEHETVIETPEVTLTPEHESVIETPEVAFTPEHETVIETPEVAFTPDHEPAIETPEVTLTSEHKPVIETPEVTLTPEHESVIETPEVTLTPEHKPVIETPEVTLTPEHEPVIETPEHIPVPVTVTLPVPPIKNQPKPPQATKPPTGKPIPRNNRTENFKAAVEELNTNTINTSPVRKKNVEALEAIFSSNPAMNPFTKQNRLMRWVRISITDPIPLPNNRPQLLEEFFVASSFALYGHLILGMTTDNGPPQYVIGVPGDYDPDQRGHAKRLGFSQFKSHEGERAQRGDKGYWLMFINI